MGHTASVDPVGPAFGVSGQPAIQDRRHNARIQTGKERPLPPLPDFPPLPAGSRGLGDRRARRRALPVMIAGAGPRPQTARVPPKQPVTVQI
jgi:hypothetical protein